MYVRIYVYAYMHRVIPNRRSPPDRDGANQAKKGRAVKNGGGPPSFLLSLT